MSAGMETTLLLAGFLAALVLAGGALVLLISRLVSRLMCAIATAGNNPRAAKPCGARLSGQGTVRWFAPACR